MKTRLPLFLFACAFASACVSADAASKALPDVVPTARTVDAAFAASFATAKLRAAAPAGDLELLRRMTLDLAGRIPTLAEIDAYQRSTAKPGARRAEAAARLVASADFADHRAWTLVDHWSEGAIARRGVDERALHRHVAGALRGGAGYDAVVRDILTAEGSTYAAGATNFLAMSDGNPTAMAVAVADRLLGLDMGCAQCHDHVDGTWKKEEFWALTSFFARTSYVPDIRDGKGAPDWHLVELPYGEVRMGMALPGSGPIVPPRFPDGTPGPTDPDAKRRDALAKWVTAPANKWFARERVEQVATLLLGAALPAAALDALAKLYVKTGFSEATLARAILATSTYARSSRPAAGLAAAPVRPLTLRTVIRSVALATGASVEEGTGAEMMGALDAMTMTRRGGGSGLDPGSSDPSLVRALFLMNGRLLDTATMPFEGSSLRTLLDRGDPAATAIDPVFLSVLGRSPTAAERAAFVAHVERAPSPRAGWADVLWALFNSSDFLFNL